MEEKALEKSLKTRFSVSKASLIYLGIALVLGALNLYAYIAGSWVPLEYLEEEQRFFTDISPIWRNLFLVAVASIILCIYMIWKNSKNYKTGLAFPDNKLAFFGSLILVIFTFLFVLVKISHVQSFVNNGLIMLTMVIADAFFIALGVFLMRASNAPKALKVILPFVGNMLVHVITFFGLFVMGNTYTVLSDVLKVLAFFAILSLFFVGSYIFTHRLSVAVIFACLWGFAVATYNHPTIVNIGMSKIIAIVGTVVCAVGGLAGIIAFFAKKKVPADDLCEYKPAEEGFGSSATVDTYAVMHSSRTLILGIISIFSMAGTFLVTSWEDISALSIAIFDFLEKLFTWSFGSPGEMGLDFQVLYTSLLENSTVLTMIPVVFLAIAYLFFFISKTPKHSRKYKSAWTLAKFAVILYMIIDIVTAVIFLNFSVNGVFDKLPEVLYKDNYILNYFANYNFVSTMTYVVVGIMALMFLYHIALFVMMTKLSKNGSEKKKRNALFYVVMIMTCLIGIPSTALAFWYMGFANPIIGIVDGAVFFILASMMLSIFKKKKDIV